MILFSALFFVLLFFLCLAAAVVMYQSRETDRQTTHPLVEPPSQPPQVARFLFRAGALVDANPAALRLCSEVPAERFDWEALRQKLSASFPDFPYAQGASQKRDVTVLKSNNPNDASIVTLDQWNDVARVTLEQDIAPDLARRTAIFQAMFQAPNPIWKINTKGVIVWRNTAYKSLGASLGFTGDSQPLFDTTTLSPGDPPLRFKLSSRDNTQIHWFNVTAVRAGPDIMFYATEADAEVSALDARRSFVQTFSKTFAQLSTGLAIFDQNQSLVLFNPALIELTGVSADFLSNRCDLFAFFDHMREHHVIPTSNGQTSWHAQVSQIVQEAQLGAYCETWTLPTGVTYKVSGRPHPDGALVFLIEDITSEITVTRRFRSELEQVYGVLDTVEGALVLFSPTGQLHMCNQAYRDMWKSDPDRTFAKYTFFDALQHWQVDCRPSPVWSKLKNRILSTSDRSAWSASLTKITGEVLTMEVTPVAGGVTLLTFKEINPVGLPLTTTH
ncbi:PAS-domain containing protein [uncultured Shimia sp.]|uniref:PAS-domain containing protein n=1 Tax=uncultured Shimia sp. TaxID=573152 RepID=UPI0026225E85|nr:PAS-domain containing protein [uncultured Shimia sp.]